MRHPTFYRAQAIITILMFMALAASASLLTPTFEAPDEIAHFAYIQHLWLERTLPELPPVTTGFRTPDGEFYQPPLFYLYGLIWGLPVARQLGQPLNYEPNPFGTTDFDSRVGGNKNAWLHSRSDDFPFDGTARAVHVIRLGSVMLSLITGIVLFRFGRSIFNDSPQLLGYLAVCLLLPGYVFNSGMTNNDNMAMLAGSLLLVYSWNLMFRANSLRHWVGLAVAAGLATLAKATTLAFFPAVATAVFFACRHLQSRRDMVSRISLLSATWLLLTGWWFWRNMNLYGELTGVRRMYLAVGESGTPSLALLNASLIWLWQTYCGRLASQTFPMPAIVYVSLAVLYAFGLAGWVKRLRAIWRHEDVHVDRWLVILLAVAGMTAAALYGSASLHTGAQGRYLYPVQGGIAAMIVAGLFALAPERFHRQLGQMLWAGMLVVAALAIWQWLPQAFALPPRREALEPQPGYVRLDYQYGDAIRLHGLDISARRLYPGDSLEVNLYWEASRSLDANYAVFLQLIDGQSNKIAQRDTYSGNGMYPTSRWKPGEIVVDTITLSIDANAPAPQVYRLIGGLWDYKTGARLPIKSADPLAVELFRLGEVAVVPISTGGLPPSALQLSAEFGSGIMLHGCSPPKDNLNEVSLFWMATQSVDRDYTVLVHLWDSTKTFIGGVDHPPMQGRFPSLFWQANDWIVDEFVLPEQAQVAQIDVGLYASDTLERLPLLDPPLPDGLFPLPTECWQP